MPRTASPARIALKNEAWNKECARHDLVTDSQKANFLGVSRQHVNAVQNGHKSAGEQLIIAALRRFPTARFEDLFEVPR